MQTLRQWGPRVIRNHARNKYNCVDMDSDDVGYESRQIVTAPAVGAIGGIGCRVGPSNSLKSAERHTTAK